MSAPTPLRPVETYAGLAMGEVLGSTGGRVCLLDSHPGWIYKEYEATPPADAVVHIDRLIRLPSQFTPVERRLVEESTRWPAARVVRDGLTTGVIMPLAPARFGAESRMPGGPGTPRLVEVDWLAKPDAEQRARKILPPLLAERVTVCAAIAGVAGLFERYGVVYLGWSLTTVFWSHRDHSAYVVDVDRSSFGPRPMIESPGWGDPLFPPGSTGGHAVDRYRVALLVARCLTAERTDTDAAVDALAQLVATRPEFRRVHDLIVRALSADEPRDRPPTSGLADALRTAAVALDPVASGSAAGGPNHNPSIRSFTPVPEGPGPVVGPEGGTETAAAATAIVLGVLVLIAILLFVVL